MYDQNATPLRTDHSQWAPIPPLYVRRTKIGATGKVYTSFTLHVPRPTDIRHFGAPFITLSNGRSSTFTRFNSLEELRTFAEWLYTQAYSEEMDKAVSLAQISVPVNIVPADTKTDATPKDS